MITLRYHITTIIAIFLSLGVGILLGAGTGQKWINQQEQQLLHSLEVKYEEAMQSNQSLQQQIQGLTNKMESSNQDFIRLLTTNYAPALQGQPIAVWSQSPEEESKVTKILNRVGMKVIEGNNHKEHIPLLVVGPVPDSIPSFSGQVVQFSQAPNSPLEQWNLFQQILLLLKESEGNVNDITKSELYRSRF